MKEDLKAQLHIIQEIDNKNIKKDKEKVNQLKDENDRLMKKYHSKFKIQIDGDSKIAKPSKNFAEDF